jgi:hypothetical protein
MRISELVERFTYYATKHKQLLHVEGSADDIAFLHLEVEELQFTIKNGIKFPCLVLQTPAVEKSSIYDSLSEDFSFTFIVVKPLGEAHKSQIIDECKTISDQVYNRIMKDCTSGIIPSLQPGTSEGIVGPMTDQLYGWGISLSILDGYDASVEGYHWNDIDPDGSAPTHSGLTLPAQLK